MGRVPEGLSRFGDRIVLAVCVLFSLWAISLDESHRFELGTRVAQRVFLPVTWGTQYIADLSSLRADNDELRRRIRSMELDAVQIAQERAHIEELKEQAGFYEKHRGALVPAEVLIRNVTRVPQDVTVRVSKTGREDSLALRQSVVSERGLVGRVSQILDDDEVVVELLTHEEARVSVESMETGVTGILRYDGRGFLMDNVPQGDPISTGDRLITSGYGGTFPRGLPVGVVRKVVPSQVELFQRVEVETYVKFSALRRVYVVTRKGPWYSRRGDSNLPEEAEPVSEEVTP